MPLIMGMSMLLACQFAGELVARGLTLSIPGPVIGMGIAEQIGGIPSLAAGIVFVDRLDRLRLGPWIFRLLRIKDPVVQGFTLAFLGLPFRPRSVQISSQRHFRKSWESSAAFCIRSIWASVTSLMNCW